MAVAGLAYEHPVQAYRTLTLAGALDAERLWRLLWLRPPGEVRQHFVPTVDAARREHGLPGLRPVQQARLASVADRVFASDRLAAQPNSAEVMRLWQTVFR
jgi:hypothetical protein